MIKIYKINFRFTEKEIPCICATIKVEIQEVTFMNNFQKAKDVLNLVVASATAIVTIAELWEKFGPDIKKAFKPVLEYCKKISSNSSNGSLAITQAD